MNIQSKNIDSNQKYSYEYFGEKIGLINAFEFYFFNLISLEDKLKNILTHCLSNILSSKSDIKKTLPRVLESQSSMLRTASSMLGTASSMLGTTSSMLGTASSMLGTASSMLGMTSSILGTTSSMLRTTSSTLGTGFIRGKI